MSGTASEASVAAKVAARVAGRKPERRCGNGGDGDGGGDDDSGGGGGRSAGGDAGGAPANPSPISAGDGRFRRPGARSGQGRRRHASGRAGRCWSSPVFAGRSRLALRTRISISSGWLGDGSAPPCRSPLAEAERAPVLARTGSCARAAGTKVDRLDHAHRPGAKVRAGRRLPSARRPFKVASRLCRAGEVCPGGDNAGGRRGRVGHRVGRAERPKYRVHPEQPGGEEAVPHPGDAPTRCACRVAMVCVGGDGRGDAQGRRPSAKPLFGRRAAREGHPLPRRRPEA